MTTTTTPRPDTFFTGLDQARSVKRLGLGPKFYDSGVSVPELVEQPDGPYVTHDDYLKLLHLATLREAVNKVLEGEVNELLAQMEAIGAGGVSSQRITSADSDTAQAMFDALAAIVQEVGPGSRPYSSDSYLPAHLVQKARAAISKSSGGDL